MWPEPADTEGLLLEVRKGDREAVNLLLAKHRPALRRMVALRLDRALARRVDPSDIVQEALVEAHRRLTEFLKTPGQPFYLWLRQIALDRLIDAHRRHRRARKRSVDREEPLERLSFPDRSSLDLALQLRAPGLTPAAEAIRKELLRRFDEALGRLDGDDREIILLRHFEGLPNRDAARALGLSAAAAGMRYLRALRRLRALLAEEDRPPARRPS